MKRVIVELVANIIGSGKDYSVIRGEEARHDSKLRV